MPSVGAGTANTEFEVLTGMSMRFFGPGEYPYKTYVKDKCHVKVRHQCTWQAWDMEPRHFTITEVISTVVPQVL